MQNNTKEKIPIVSPERGGQDPTTWGQQRIASSPEKRLSLVQSNPCFHKVTNTSWLIRIASL